jgi:hypothetical protein
MASCRGWPVKRLACILTALLGILATAAHAQDAGALFAVLAGEALDVTDPYLVAWYKFEGDVTDSSGTNDGTVVGTAIYTNRVTGNQAFRFNATTHITTTFRWQNHATDRLTVTWWQWNNLAHNDSTQHGIFTQDVFGGNFAQLSMVKYSDNKIYAGFFQVGGETRVILNASAALWPQNTWTHYAMTLISGGRTILYRDGTEIGRNTVATIFRSPAASMRYGITGESVRFSGRLDEIRWYSRALSSNDVGRVYQGLRPNHD